MLAVLVLSLVPPGPALPTTGWDKTHHLFAFGVLALLGRCGYPRPALERGVLDGSGTSSIDLLTACC